MCDSQTSNTIFVFFGESHKKGVNFGYLCTGPSKSHPSPLGWEMRDASRLGLAVSLRKKEPWRTGATTSAMVATG